MIKPFGDDIDDYIDDLFNELFGNSSPPHHYHRKQITPEKFERLIDKDNIYYTFDLPLYSREEIDIDIGEKHLYITLLNKDGYDESETIKFPYPIDRDDVKITFINGILDITCPIRKRKHESVQKD